MKLLKSIFLTLLAVTVITSGTAPKSYAEAPGTASFSVSGGTYAQNSTFTLSLYETSSVPVNAICAGIMYDQTKLKLVSIGQAASNQYDLPSRECGGTTNITRVATPFGSSWAGKNLFATITFRALGDSGSTAIGFSSGSMILPSANIDPENPSIWDENTNGTILNLTAPIVAQSPQPVKKSTQPVTESTPAQKPAAAATQSGEATLGAETTKPAAPTAQPNVPENSDGTQVITLEASQVAGTSYLTAAYFFAAVLLGGSLLVVKRRYNLRKQS